MGMAASQARWISLAARKTNVEYEGQQINQARTALANQSAELWNKLYKMDVPTPPSTTDFTKTVYSFTSGTKENKVESIQDADETIDGINYNSYVTYSTDVSEYKGIRTTNYNPQVQKVSATADHGEYYMVGTNSLTCLADVTDPDEKNTYVQALNQIVKDWPDSPLAKVWNDTTQDEDNIWFWVDTANNANFAVTGDANTPDTLEYCMAKPAEHLHLYYGATQITNKEVSKYAVIDYDSSGRAKSIQLEGSTIVYDMNTNTQTDDNAYNDAMNKYYYDKQVYEKRVQDINAKTEQIQTEDRTLEIRLKQLDTEQNALQTEMEAVHKVIQKNIESTFKTFES